MNTRLLERLINASGVSGDESQVREIISKEIKKHVNEVFVDNLGNLIAHKKGKKPRVMLAAHMDEIGLMVRSIDKDGKIYFSKVGGIEPIILIGQRVKIEGIKEEIHGIITNKDLSDDYPIEEIPRIQDLFIDAGLTKGKLVKKGIEIGSYVSLDQDMGVVESEDTVSGKALDDRIGCYILIELAKRLKSIKNEVYFVFTVQEEIGLYGAKTSTYSIEPDWSVVVDVTNADENSYDLEKKIGDGPCIVMKDAEVITNRCISNWLKKIAKRNKIPVQLEVSDIGTTDALNISITKKGVPSSVLAVAVRNLHTTVGIAHKEDIENSIKLLELLMKKPPLICLV